MNREPSELVRGVLELERRDVTWMRVYEREYNRELSKMGFSMSSGTLHHTEDGKKHPYFHIADNYTGRVGLTFPTLSTAVFFPSARQGSDKEFRERLSFIELLFGDRGYHVNEFANGDLAGALKYTENRTEIDFS